jgi:hypothetical protein
VNLRVRIERLEAHQPGYDGLSLLVRAMAAAYSQDARALADLRSEIVDAPPEGPDDGQLIAFSRALLEEQGEHGS